MSNAVAVRSVLGSQTDDKTVVAQALLKLLTSAQDDDERCELLGVAFTERDSAPKIPKALPNIGISDDAWDQLNKSHADIVNAHLKMAFFKSRTARDFGAEVLRLISFFGTDDEKTYTLAKALFSPYVPYLQLPGTPVHMTNAEFKQKLESEKPRLELIAYIIQLPFDEYTERASMLLQVLDDTPDKGVRVALLAAAWRHHEDRVASMVKASK